VRSRTRQLLLTVVAGLDDAGVLVPQPLDQLAGAAVTEESLEQAHRILALDEADEAHVLRGLPSELCLPEAAQRLDEARLHRFALGDGGVALRR